MLRLPGYQVTHLLGRGVYSEVYAASPTVGPSKPLAVKLLKPAYHKDDWVLECFRREGVIGGAVRHPALLCIHRSNSEAGSFAHICSRVEGHSLRDAGPITPGSLIAILTRVAAALSALHRAGYVHGDVKPANMLQNHNGDTVLIDLGFAREPGHVSFENGLPGTPNYLAPELCRRAILDTPAADVFSLGVTAYELRTGHLPYPVLSESAEVLRQHRDEPPQWLRRAGDATTDALDDLINRMLAVNVFARPKASRIVAELSALQTLPRTRAA